MQIFRTVITINLEKQVGKLLFVQHFPMAASAVWQRGTLLCLLVPCGIENQIKRISNQGSHVSYNQDMT